MADIADDAAAHWPDGAVTRADLSEVEIPDLDEDAAAERVVIAEYASCGVSGNCIGTLYFSGGGCAQRGGTIAYREGLEVLPSTRHSVHDFRIFLTDGCAGRAGAFITYRFTGRGFSEVERVSCSCPDDHPTPQNPPICGR